MLKEIVSQIKKINTDRNTLRKFCLISGVILFVIGSISLARTASNNYPIFFIGGLLFITTGIILPSSIKCFYVFWMAVSFVLGWVISRVILALLFFFLITPFGFFLRVVLKKDLLDEKIDLQKNSYWIKCNEIENRKKYTKPF